MQMRLVLIAALLTYWPSLLNAQNERENWLESAPRTSIALFRYRGAVRGEESGAQFDAFRGLLEQKIENLITVLEPELQEFGALTQANYIGKLHVKLIETDNLQGRSQVFAWMGAEGDVLQTLRGSILKTPNGLFRISTRTHQVDAAAPNGKRVFVVDLALTPEEFANSKDSHSLALLYGIAAEAQRAKVSIGEIKTIAAMALNMIADIERRGGKVDQIKQAWMDLVHGL